MFVALMKKICIYKPILLVSHSDAKAGSICHGGFKYQGPVVQSIVSLTSSLRGQPVKYFTTL